MLTVAVFDGLTVQRLMVLVGSCLIVFDILYDKERSQLIDILFYGSIAVLFAVPMATAMSDNFVVITLAIPICYLLFVVLFFSGVLAGGADVKCLISLAIIFPMYPVIYGIPLISVPAASIITSIISFPLAVLLYASLFSVLLMMPLMIMNIRRGDTEFPNMLFGYRVDAKEAEELYVWPMAVKKNKSKNSETSNETQDDGKIWVTPKIPFIIPITAAVIFTAVIGNIAFLF